MNNKNNLLFLFPFLLFLLSSSSFTLASDGDKEERYRAILKRCTSNCKEVIKSLSFIEKYILCWDCLSTCRYRSMWINENEKEPMERLKVQYHGKWPFRSFSGIQEPASTILSIGNLLSHWIGLSALKRRTLPSLRNPSYNTYRKYLIVNSFISMMGWGFSAIFHSRDLPITEKMDYFGAAAIILIGLNMAILRCLIIERKCIFSPRTSGTVSLFLLSMYTFHCLKMIRKFDFGWNMKFCLCCGIGQCLIWLFWCTSKNGGIYIAKRYCILAVFLTLAASTFEIFDFPPILGFLDSHALWHLATIPIIFVWYKFYITDLLLLQLSSSSSSTTKIYSVLD